VNPQLVEGAVYEVNDSEGDEDDLLLVTLVEGDLVRFVWLASGNSEVAERYLGCEHHFRDGPTVRSRFTWRRVL